MNPDRTTVCICDMNAEVPKSTALQHLLLCTPLSRMANRRKHVTYTYSGVLGYKITIYSKHCEELAQGTERTAQPDERNDEESSDVHLSKEHNASIR